MEISVNNLQRRIPLSQKKIVQVAQDAAKELGLELNSLSIVFIGPKRMRRINREYLGHDHVTDVITFEYGEILICPQIARHNAKEYKVTVQHEICLYVIHGLLHLAGFDDHSLEDQKKMRRQERILLERHAS